MLKEDILYSAQKKRELMIVARFSDASPLTAYSLEPATSKFSYQLLGRITSHWKEIVMIAGTALAINCAVAALFYGSVAIAVPFFLLGGLTAMGAFYMRQFSSLQSLENTAKGLAQERARFSTIATQLEHENNRLKNTNQDLIRTNESFKQTNQQLIETRNSLQATNRQLQESNDRLTRQVTLLTVQVTQLRESAERIKLEMQRFNQSNTSLAQHVQSLNDGVRILDRHIDSSRALCSEITQQFSSQQQSLGQQMHELTQYLKDLCSDQGVVGRINSLQALQQQIAQATSQLNAISVQQAQERGRLETIRDILVRLREEFNTVLGSLHSANQTHLAHNQQLGNNVQWLAQEREKIQKLLNTFFAQPPTN